MPLPDRGNQHRTGMALRYIDNEIRDFQVGGAAVNNKKERKSSKARKADAFEDELIHSALRLSLQRILREAPPVDAARSRDFSVYTGTAGYCLLFLVLHSRGIGFGVAGRAGQLAGFSCPLELAAAYLDAAQACLDKQVAKRGAANQGFTFLTGAAGVHAVGAAVAQRTGDMARCRRHAREVAAMEELALSEGELRSHDVLNGLAGYLSALLFIRANTREDVGEEEVSDQLLLRVVDRIVCDGAEAPCEGRWSSPNSPSSSAGAALSHDDDGSSSGGAWPTAAPSSGSCAADGGGGGGGGGGGAGGAGSSRSNGGGGGSGGDAARADTTGGDHSKKNGSRRSSEGRRRRRGGKGRRGGGGGGSSGDITASAGAAAAAAADEQASAKAAAAAAAAEDKALAEAAAEAAAAAAAAEDNEGMEYGGVLTYEWHGKMYLGAARGVSGILFVLMQALQTVYGDSLLVGARAGDGSDTEDLPPQAAEQLYLIRSTVDAVLNTVLPEGNFPSRPVSADDRLVQWCHGSPGIIPMLTKAHEVFEDDRYLEMARRSSEVVWKRGLLMKGNGICHGVAGNGYAFLSLRKADAADGRHQHRARSFAGFAASAVLGPNSSTGANASSRGDPFGPGAHVHHPRGGGFGLGRSSSHDAGKSIHSAGWPSNGCNSGGGDGGAGDGGGGGGRAGAGGRSHSVGSGGACGAGGEMPSQVVPDRPMSLFEGLAGSAAFLADCCVSEAGAGEHAWFPSLELCS